MARPPKCILVWSITSVTWECMLWSRKGVYIAGLALANSPMAMFRACVAPYEPKYLFASHQIFWWTKMSRGIKSQCWLSTVITVSIRLICPSICPSIFSSLQWSLDGYFVSRYIYMYTWYHSNKGALDVQLVRFDLEHSMTPFNNSELYHFVVTSPKWLIRCFFTWYTKKNKVSSPMAERSEA